MGRVADATINQRHTALVIELATEITQLRGLNKAQINHVIHEAESRIDQKKAVEQAEHLEKCKIEIASWPKVNLEDGTAPVCTHCKSRDIHSNPLVTSNWGCASCGHESTSPYIGFCQTLACSACGWQFPEELGPEACRVCGQEFKPLPPF